MKNRPWLILVLFLVLSGGLCAVQLIKIGILIRQGSYTLAPFEQNNPSGQPRLLILGDSTAVGTGAGSNQQSVAGHFGRDFPAAHIINISKNGRKLHEVLKAFTPADQEHYDLAVIQAGGNDILRFSSYGDIERGVAHLLQKVKGHASRIVILHSGDVGEAPVFIWPFNWIMTQRTLRVRDIYIKEASRAGAVYLDLYQELKGNPIVSSKAYYAPDLLHPSAVGYGMWYERIRAALSRAGVSL